MLGDICAPLVCSGYHSCRHTPTFILEARTPCQYVQLLALGGGWAMAETSSASMEKTNDGSQE